MTNLPPIVRFMLYVSRDPESGCWEWTGGKMSGYGIFHPRSNGQRSVGAHRWIYEYIVGPVPEGLQIDHLCRNPGCVNVRHMEPVTPRTNTMRGEGRAAHNARKTHCIRGHEFTLENTYRPPGAPNKRQCLACRRMRDRLAYIPLDTPRRG